MNEPTPEDIQIISALADELLRRIPALDTLSALKEEVGEVSAAGGRVHFEMRDVIPMEAMERAYVHFVLTRCDGNKSRAAELLAINPSTLYRKLSRWGM